MTGSTVSSPAAPLRSSAAADDDRNQLLLGLLAQTRGVATRYGKLALRYEATIQVAVIDVWLRDLAATPS